MRIQCSCYPCEVERLTQVAARLASEAACERLRAEKAEAEVERLRKAISNVMTDDQLSTIVPAIGMTTREALRGEGEKCPECEGSGATGAGKPCCSVRRGEGEK